MAHLVLDAEALSALARPQQDPRRHQRVRAAMRSAHGRNAPVRIPSAVLIGLYRGHGSDEAIDAVLARGFAQVVTSGIRIARIAGSLLAEAGARSEMAIDALVIATAIRFGGGIAPPTTPTNYHASPPPPQRRNPRHLTPPTPPHRVRAGGRSATRRRAGGDP